MKILKIENIYIYNDRTIGKFSYIFRIPCNKAIKKYFFYESSRLNFVINYKFGKNKFKKMCNLYKK